MIGNVSSSVLILNGLNDILTPIEDALLLEQRLTMIGHPDHTLITYPGLGHYFYPEDYWGLAMDPIQEYGLQDLEAWLKDPARSVHRVGSQLEAAEKAFEELQSQLEDLNTEVAQRTGELEGQIEELLSESNSLKDTIAELEDRNAELQSSLNSAKNLTYVSLGAAALAFIVAVALLLQRQRT